jgi:hypothetical protein
MSAPALRWTLERRTASSAGSATTPAFPGLHPHLLRHTFTTNAAERPARSRREVAGSCTVTIAPPLSLVLVWKICRYVVDEADLCRLARRLPRATPAITPTIPPTAHHHTDRESNVSSAKNSRGPKMAPSVYG